MRDLAAVIRISAYRGFDPASPTLIGPFWARGIVYDETRPDPHAHSRPLPQAQEACLGEDAAVGQMEFFDSAVTPRSGDLVLLIGANRRYTEKCLVDVAGMWHLTCHWATWPLALVNFEAIAPRVLTVRFPAALRMQHPEHQSAASEVEFEARRRMNTQHRFAIRHLLDQGIQSARPFRLADVEKDRGQPSAAR